MAYDLSFTYKNINTIYCPNYLYYISYILHSLYLHNYFLNSIIIIFIRRDLFKIDPLIAEAKADRIESIKFVMFEENGKCATGTLTKN